MSSWLEGTDSQKGPVDAACQGCCPQMSWSRCVPGPSAQRQTSQCLGSVTGVSERIKTFSNAHSSAGIVSPAGTGCDYVSLRLEVSLWLGPC